jgi:hypothetical protein
VPSKAASIPDAVTLPKAYRPQRGVIVIVETEEEQAAAFDRLKALGFTRLRVVTA